PLRGAERLAPRPLELAGDVARGQGDRLLLERLELLDPVLGRAGGEPELPRPTRLRAGGLLLLALVSQARELGVDAGIPLLLGPIERQVEEAARRRCRLIAELLDHLGQPL